MDAINLITPCAFLVDTKRHQFQFLSMTDYSAVFPLPFLSRRSYHLFGVNHIISCQFPSLLRNPGGLCSVCLPSVAYSSSIVPGGFEVLERRVS